MSADILLSLITLSACNPVVKGEPGDAYSGWAGVAEEHLTINCDSSVFTVILNVDIEEVDVEILSLADPLTAKGTGGGPDVVLQPGVNATLTVADRLRLDFSHPDVGSAFTGTAVVILRLNYAVELRYGVLVDIARRVHAGEPIDLAMGHLNCIWQGDACDLTLRALALAASPPAVLNLTGPSVLSVRDLAGRLGELLGRQAACRGAEAETALLANPKRICSLLGEPPTPLDAVLRWTASWIRQGGRLLGKPTHFEVRDGKY